MPVILQAERNECGVAAIAMVANHFGHRLTLSSLRKQFASHIETVTLKSMLLMADALGLSVRPVKAGIGDIRRLKRPAILHWNLNHFVVLVAVRRRGIVINDPAAGRRFVSYRDVRDAFSGVAVEFSIAGNFQTLDTGRGPGFFDFAKSVQGLGRYLWLMLVLLLATQILALAPPIATQLLIDNIVLGQDQGWLYRVLAGIAMIMLTMLGIDALRRWVALYTGTRLAADSTTAIIRHLFHLPVATVERRPIGDLISRIQSLQPIRAAITETCLHGIVQIVIIGTTLAVMIFYSGTLALLSVVTLLFIAIFQIALLPASRAANLEAVVASAQSSQSLIETLRSFQAMRALSLGPQRLAHWQSYFATAINAGARQTRLAIITGIGQGVLTAAEQLLFLAIGISGIADKQLTLGVLFAFLSLRGRLTAAAVQLLNTGRDLYLLRTHVDRVGEIVMLEPEPSAPSTAYRKRVIGAVACRELSFRYPGGTPILNRFSCFIEPGEAVVIAGGSGAGKTTLLNLLTGGLQADGGAVLFDDVELPLWDVDVLRQQFGIVLQQDQLFQGSVADNISCFEVGPDVGKIRAAAQLAMIWNDITDLPMSIHTPVGASGNVLSGGQVQRLLLARALYREPRILFLDEATSHLDELTESHVLKNLRSLGITTISVAHGENALKYSGRHLPLHGESDKPPSRA